MITFIAQREIGTVVPVESLPVSNRLDNALIAYFLYIWKTFWPAGLAVIYSRIHPWPFWQVLLAGSFLFVVALLVVRVRRSFPYLVVGWLWFLGTLIPMIGLVQVGGQFMADRYSYISSIGLFLVVIWGVAEVAGGAEPLRRALPAIVVMALSAAVLLTRDQLQFWENSVKLFSRAVEVTRNNWLAHHNLAIALANDGRYDQAEAQFLKALEITPRNTTVNESRGNLYLEWGKFERAIECYQEVLALRPRQVGIHYTLGLIYSTCPEAAFRNGGLAVTHARFVCESSQGVDCKNLDLLAAAYAESGQFKEAVETAQKAYALAAASGVNGFEIRKRLELYKSQRPYRRVFAKASRSTVSPDAVGSENQTEKTQ